MFAPTPSPAAHQNAYPPIPNEVMLTDEFSLSETMSVLTTRNNVKPTRVEHPSNLTLQTSNTGEEAMLKMLPFRSSRIQRRSSMSCGTLLPATPNDLTNSIMDMNLVGMISQGKNFTGSPPEANHSSRSMVTIVDSFDFEPTDPRVAFLELEFADELLIVGSMMEKVVFSIYIAGSIFRPSSRL